MNKTPWARLGWRGMIHEVRAWGDKEAQGMFLQQHEPSHVTGPHKQIVWKTKGEKMGKSNGQYKIPKDDVPTEGVKDDAARSFREWSGPIVTPGPKIIDDVEDLDEDAKPAAVRDDGGKMKWHLLPIPALLALCKVFHGGALKYAEDQWRGGMKFSRIYRSMISHFMKWLASNNSYDKELGTHHLMMVAWGCFVLYMYEVIYKFVDYDDRPEKGLLTDEDFEFVHEMVANRLTAKQIEVLEEQWKAKHIVGGPFLDPQKTHTLDKDDKAREMKEEEDKMISTKGWGL